ncbi:MAG: phage major capsid protein [Phenylobacterium sp.]|uniref:phage major capsid protein n=1 Tax=Phenylobacterium sp. TaxID=1871053 RepID=UPI002731E7C7|nr:phage major capsid protein [Phenylobacterium sp.]MDP2010634.1 phage major capsid protein [Phenylobacterium sp.]
MKHDLQLTASAAALAAAGALLHTKEDGGLDLIAKSVEDLSKAADQRIGDLTTKNRELDARMGDLEQKSARGGYGGASAPETWGRQVAESEQIKSVNANWRGSVRIEVKAATLTSATTDAAGSVGDGIAPSRPPGVITLPRRTLRLRQLFAPGNTSGGSIEWPKMTGRTNGAETQTEGATKGQSDFKFDLVQWPVRTIAHFLVASKQILDDMPALQSIIDSELLYGLAVVEDAQLLSGGGTGTDLTGVYTTATAFDAPFDGDPLMTEIDVLLQAIAQVDDTDWEADGIVLHPLDWRRIQGLKDGEGRYLSGGPFSAEHVARLWALPIATSKAMTQGTFMAGAFSQGAQIFDRQEATVEISTEDSDNFRKNLVTVRAEERLAFVIKHPEAFVKGTFATALAA